MMHIRDGELRSFIDHELDASQVEKVQAHLEHCASCAQKMEVLRLRASRVGEGLASLSSLPKSAQLSQRAALNRYVDYSKRKEQPKMWNKLFTRPYRPVWIALTFALIFGLALISPQVRAVASNFLGIFRVQRITVVQVDPRELQVKLGSTSELESLIAKDVQVNSYGEVQDAASAAEASELAGIAVRLPTKLQETPELLVAPGAQVTFNIDLELVRSILAEMGRSDIQLPDELDGAHVVVDLPATVAAMYGDCATEVPPDLAAGHTAAEVAPPSGTNCTTLIQLASPSADVPEGLEIAQIGQAFLELMGMSADEAARFSQTLDWTTTFVIPIPKNQATFMDVTVDGVPGTFIQKRYHRVEDQSMLVWVKDGIVYSLTSAGDINTILELANSLVVP